MIIILLTKKYCHPCHSNAICHSYMYRNPKLTISSLLSPIGHHRTSHITPSKGKRNKKRKRQEAAKSDTAQKTKVEAPVPAPELNSHILIGLNSISRHLDSQSQSTRPTSLCIRGPNPTHEAAIITSSTPAHLAAVFITRPSLPPILAAHLHLLLETSSFLNPILPSTRLITLPKNSEKRLCDALGVPRAGFIGIMHHAPNALALLDFCFANVPEIQVGEWLKSVKEVYMPVKINAVEIAAPPQEK